MRAVYLENLKNESIYRLDKDVAHHLINVIRIKKDEEILLLDGQGKRIITVVDKVHKREVVLRSLSSDQDQNKILIDIALGVPKKEALELSLKQAQELGIGTVYLVRAKYSQIRPPEIARVQSLLVSALEQSNASFLTKAHEADWKEIDYSQYDAILVLDSQNKVESKVSVKGKILLIIGPEGGFSDEEFELFKSLPKLTRLNLPTPILRTPTALAAGVGLVLGRLND